MATININDGVVTYHAEVPDDLNDPPNFHQLKHVFADGYDSGDCGDCVPFECEISGDFEGSFLLHGNGKGGTIESDDPWSDFPDIEWN